MAKHILDRQRRLKAPSALGAYTAVERRSMPVGTSKAARMVARRMKGPLNDAKRAEAFLRIDRGHEV
jgi:hypothetical protein